MENKIKIDKEAYQMLKTAWGEWTHFRLNASLEDDSLTMSKIERAVQQEKYEQENN